MALEGEFSFIPLTALSKRQTCVSHSTPEAEIVAADLAVRTEGMPALTLWETLLEKPMVIKFREDNAAAIRVIQTGKNPTMRYMGRTHNVDLAWLHEQMTNKQFAMEYCDTARQAGDIFTIDKDLTGVNVQIAIKAINQRAFTRADLTQYTQRLAR